MQCCAYRVKTDLEAIQVVAIEGVADRTVGLKGEEEAPPIVGHRGRAAGVDHRHRGSQACMGKALPCNMPNMDIIERGAYSSVHHRGLVLLHTLVPLHTLVAQHRMGSTRQVLGHL